jgi:hypothetical protein
MRAGHIGTLSILALTAAISFGAMAADLPKEGTFSGTYSAAGTYKAYPVGKDRTLVMWEENGLSVGKGVFDHTTSHCFGLADIANGMEQDHGYCVVTDIDGDQSVTEDVSDGKRPTSAKSFGFTGTLTSGTGKYAGISGEWTGVMHGPDFRTDRTGGPEGTYVQYGEFQAKYKVP